MTAAAANDFIDHNRRSFLVTQLSFKRSAALTALAACSLAAQAADWSDTSIGFRYGTKYAEPFNPNDIKKGIVNFTHAAGTSTAPLRGLRQHHRVQGEK
jgi:hypothetical protein